VMLLMWRLDKRVSKLEWESENGKTKKSQQ